MADTELEYAWFFRTEFPSVLRTVYLILRDRGRAEDIAQDAFTQLYTHWRKVSRYERPEAWVRRIAIRMALRQQKRDRLRAVLERKAVGPTFDRTTDIDLAEAMTSLSPTQRAVIVLYYYEDRPTAEIVEILGMSQSTVRVHLSRARRHLADLLREEVAGDVG
ncbi:MAG: sigma-70 family RNA polymerase sigma factor [Actinomycetota bacterium]|nr:sigma-70 family RNA polymerase sigma factor [Actinomycetota bacterium]